jgi:hypothetical protein
MTEKMGLYAWHPLYKSYTMGELARSLDENGLLHVPTSDNLPSYLGNKPTFCIYASIRDEQKKGTLQSNCADAPPAPSQCQLEPSSLIYDWGVVSTNTPITTTKNSVVTLVCTRPTDVRLYVSGGNIVLNGDVSTRAELDLGGGWGKPIEIRGVSQGKVQMNARLVGVGERAGQYEGSSVLVMEAL